MTDSTSVTIKKALKNALRRAGIQISIIEQDFDEINDLDLLYKLEKAWVTLTNVKSFANFISDDLGIGKGRCVIIIADKSDLLAGIMKVNLKDAGSKKHLITVANSFTQAKELVSYYVRLKSLCVLVTDIALDARQNDSSKSGMALIRWAKDSAFFHGTNVYCVAVASSHEDSYRIAAMQKADLYIPKGYAPITLKDLVERQIMVRESLMKS